MMSLVTWWHEWLWALGGVGAMAAGGIVPALAAAKLSRSESAAGSAGVAGFIAAAFGLAVAIGFRLGWRVYGSPSFLWGMSGFAVLGGLLALLMGTFATDAPRSAEATRRAFLLGFSATFLGALALGIPFAAFVSWPRTLWLRPVLAPAAIFLMAMVASPLGRIAAAIVFGKRKPPPPGFMTGLGESSEVPPPPPA